MIGSLGFVILKKEDYTLAFLIYSLRVSKYLRLTKMVFKNSYRLNVKKANGTIIKLYETKTISRKIPKKSIKKKNNNLRKKI